MRVGSLCSGAGGLDLAVETVFGAQTAWHAETDSAASKVLAYRWPGVPNHGDLTTCDWTRVEPVDIMAAGWPCQPWSSAGKRKGNEDERAIWPSIAGAVRVVRPRFVVLENVTTVLRVGEFQRVASSLAEIGYDLRWACLRASDVGAPHRRERLFVIAYTDDVRRHGWWLPYEFVMGEHDEIDGQRWCESVKGCRGTVADTSGEGCCGGAQFDGEPLTRRETSQQQRHPDRRDVETGGTVNLLPTPDASLGRNRHDNGQDPAKRRAVGRQVSVADIVCYLPTPNAVDGARRQDFARANRDASGGDDLVTLAVKVSRADQWGKYGTAIARWEQLTRPAPPPTEPNRNGNPRLNPAFSEWMMGWPQGWVTDPAVGIARDDQLRIIGNGVVPQQAIAALRLMVMFRMAAP